MELRLPLEMSPGREAACRAVFGTWGFSLLGLTGYCRIWIPSYGLSAQPFYESWTSLVAQMVKHLSMMQETQVQSLGWEDPLEKEMAIHSSTIAWKIPWTEEPGRLQSMGLQRVGHD